MRKLIIVPTIAAVAILGLTGCSKEVKEAPKPTSPTASTAPATPTPPASPGMGEETPEATPGLGEETPEPASGSGEYLKDNPALDQQYAGFLKQNIKAYAAIDDTTLAKDAKRFCKDFVSSPATAAAQNFYDYLKTSYSLDAYDAGVTMGAATGAYCNEMTPQLKNAVQGITE